jgi:acyl carrier protein
MYDLVKIKKIMSNVLEVELDQINEKSAIDNIDKWNSLSHIALIIALEKEYDIEISAQETVKMVTFQAIVDKINCE